MDIYAFMFNLNKNITYVASRWVSCRTFNMATIRNSGMRLITLFPLECCIKP